MRIAGKVTTRLREIQPYEYVSVEDDELAYRGWNVTHDTCKAGDRTAHDWYVYPPGETRPVKRFGTRDAAMNYIDGRVD